jgi:hypothetical protein
MVVGALTGSRKVTTVSVGVPVSLRVRLTSLGPYSRNVWPTPKVRERQPLARCRVSWPVLDGDQGRAGVDVPAGAAAGLEGDVDGGDVDRPAGGQPDAGDPDVAGPGDGAAGQQLGGDARGRGGRGLLARQGEQGGDHGQGEDGDRGGEAQRPVGQLGQGSSLLRGLLGRILAMPRALRKTRK